MKVPVARGRSALPRRLAGVAWPVRITSIFRLWLARMRQRRTLDGLSDHALKDIGITRADAETGKRFWRG